MKNTLLSLGITLFLASTSAQAAFIATQTGVNLTSRDCSAVNDPDYMNQWGDAIRELAQNPNFGIDPNNITMEDACIFNSQWQQYYPDGEVTAGSRESVVKVLQDAVSTSLSGDNASLIAVLDDQRLNLPEAYFSVTSQQGQRNSANLVSYQAYQWQGQDTTLVFEADLHFLMSTGDWQGSDDAHYNFTMGAYGHIDMSPDSVFPGAMENELGIAMYSTRGDSIVADTDIYRNLRIEFDVRNGQQFALYTLSQAFALNGGYVDSSNSMVSQLSVLGLDAQQSQQLVQDSLKVRSSVVSEPAVLALILCGFIGLRRRRV